MGPFRWVLLLVGVGIIGLVFAYSRGLLPSHKIFTRIRRLRDASLPEEAGEPGEQGGPEQPEAPEEPAKPETPEKPKPPPIAADSKVVTVRIMPLEGTQFPAEELVLALRNVGLRHGQFGIFSSHRRECRQLG